MRIRIFLVSVKPVHGKGLEEGDGLVLHIIHLGAMLLGLKARISSSLTSL